jgi:5-methylcytosine-specific restriction endonuclease McrA
MTKICTKCKIYKDESEFNKASRAADKLDGRCKTCKKIINAANYKDNKKEIDARHKVYTSLHREQSRLCARLGYIRNIEQNKKRSKIYRGDNPDKFAAYSAKRRATKLNQTPPWVTKEEHTKISLLYEKTASLTKETGVKHHVDHIYPLRSPKGSGFHCLANLQILTEAENLTKSNKWPE